MARKLVDILENKKEDEHRKVFVETDPNSPFPNDTISAIKREINTAAKDLETDWKDGLELLNHVFTKLDVPRPLPQQKERWEQFKFLIGTTVTELYNSRGLHASWRENNKYKDTEAI